MTTHAGDALSALLDGELTDVEAADVRAHVAGCAECSAELEGAREAREMLRGLPAVDPPAGWIEELVSDGKVVALAPRRRLAMTTMITSVAAGLLLLVLAGNQIGLPEHDPRVATAVGVHESSADGLAGSLDPSRAGGGDPTAEAALQRALDRIAAPFVAPRELAGYVLVEATFPDDSVHLVYGKGGHALSLFERRGSVDFDALTHGERRDIAGHAAWQSDDGAVVVVDDDEITFTIVGDEGDAVLDVAGALPSSADASITERVTRAVADALELLSPAP
jgi:hypothetical protein